ncbi:MAG: EAL domain-containing protein [Gammaproteobacteria bacterium]|nr:EAL domain-containing protein [Gammaproteobacteria bacterium]
MIEQKQSTYQPIILIIIALAFIQFISWIKPSLLPLEHVANYAPVHTSLEFISIIISVMIFSIIFAKTDRKCSLNLIILACTSLSVALFDFVHTMSFPGMPDFFTPNGPEKTIDFWLAGRAFSAIGLLIIAFSPWQTTYIDKLRWILLLATLILCALFIYVVLFFPELTPKTYIDGQGLTSVKIVSEYCLIALYLTAALRFFYQIHSRQHTYNIMSLFTATTMLAMSELFFTFYSDVTDIYNLLGHIYKLIAYVFIYHAVFISSIKAPYQQMYESKNLLQSVIESIPLRIFWKDRESRFLGCNTLFAHDAGESEPIHIINKNDSQLAWKKDAELYRADDQQVMNTMTPKLAYEEPQTKDSGERIWLRTSKVPLFNTANDVIGILGMYEDITQQKQAEQTRIKLDRQLQLLSQCNSTLIHANDEQSILNDICRLTVEIGGYKMAWVGLKENDKAKTVNPIVKYGDFGDYFEHLHITWDDSELGQGPTGTAIRTQQPIINQDYLSNPRMKPWRNQALRLGYQSSIALPLASSNIVIGALSIYSDEPHAFVEEEVRLLEELANDLAYGIITLRTRLERQEMEKTNAFLVHHDTLTHLPNRLLLRDRFEQAIALAQRQNTLVAILLLDLDNFKHINDSLGHTLGDKLLIHSVERMQLCIRQTDTISRQGGDEFIILLTNLDDVATAETITQEILEIFREPIQMDEYVLNVSFSIGISMFPNDSKNFDGLVKRADTALYKAKDAGKRTYRFFSEQMNVDAVENMKLQSSLHRALTNEEFQLHYQPQFNTISGELIGAEALLRWQHPELGLVSPAKFIPLAERSGLIVEIGEWVINEACKQAQIWNHRRTSPLIMAVNLSAIQFKRGNIIDTVKLALAQSGLNSTLLELELTESILMNDLDIAIKTLNSLREMGIHISIDDFGTGYSSLSYLKKLAVNKLKIDQSFVADMVDNSDDAAIVRTIIQMGHTLQLSVIAEGVETLEQLNLLKNYGCDEIQGYFYSRPIPADEFSRYYNINWE